MDQAAATGGDRTGEDSVGVGGKRANGGRSGGSDGVVDMDAVSVAGGGARRRYAAAATAEGASAGGGAGTAGDGECGVGGGVVDDDGSPRAPGGKLCAGVGRPVDEGAEPMLSIGPSVPGMGVN